MKKTVLISTVISLFGAILASPANAGKEDLVGMEVVNDMRIEFYMEAPKHGMISTSGKQMKTMGMKPTHHPEVKVFDTESGNFIPYLDITLQIEHKNTGKKMNITLPPMLGGWFHYGRNAALPEKGEYQITVEVIPQELMRYKRMAKKWAAPASITFPFSWN
jgi:uncharacterized protein involved in high-affinity Fe2+ transport